MDSEAGRTEAWLHRVACRQSVSQARDRMRKTGKLLMSPFLLISNYSEINSNIWVSCLLRSVQEVNSTAFLGKLFGLLTTLLKVRTFFLMSNINLSHIHPLAKNVR